ncbi:MAG: ShlB/FhaC/HecB family hemolysin secretion/activation protein [Prochloraceae cyanobacterium]|nr:ShlB/FhaC/HecB family hemolysin secretion/activation protein [Prochloraceae cyanobacterium]
MFKQNLVIWLTLGFLVFFSRDSLLAHSLAVNSKVKLNKRAVANSQTKYPVTARTALLSQVPIRPPLPPQPPQPPRPVPQPSPEIPLQVPTPTPPSPEELPELPATITVIRFEFDGNTAFNDEQLTEVTKVFTNRPISFAELLQAEAAVTKLYTNAGYLNSGAVIPAGQTFAKEGAIVKIQIIEGGVEEIFITGTDRLNSDYIRSRLAIATQTPLNQNRLLEALQLLQLDPLIENISAELSAGSRRELSVLALKVKEADSFTLEIIADNGRVPSVGSFQRGLRVEEGNLLGSGDKVFAEYRNTDGSNTLNLRYSLPLNPRNGTFNIAGGLTFSEVIEPPFDPLDITGDSYYFDLNYRQPIVQTPRQELALGIIASRQTSKNTLLGRAFPLSIGADNKGETRISALRLPIEWNQRSSKDVLALRSQFNLGLGAFNATVNEEFPDSRFFSWRGQGQYVRLLARDNLLVIRSDLQLATSPLLALEQFRIGGLQSVRGYRQDLLLTDNGLFTSAEVRLPIIRVEEVEGVLQLIPFIDYGKGWNSSRRDNPSPQNLLSAGLGVQWQMRDRLNARFDWGIPLTKVISRDRTLQEQGFYFSINYSLF